MFKQTIQAALMVAMASPQPASASIFGKDDRQVVSEAFPVGTVGGWLAGRGSGFLISECHVLTAAHVVGSKTRVGKRVHFRLTQTNSHSRGTVIASGTPDIPNGDFREDWALIELEKCLGKKHGFLPPAGLSSPGTTHMRQLSSYGFPSDKGRVTMMVDPLCQIYGQSPAGFVHDCATKPGNSGGPIVRWNPNSARYEAIAISVAGHHYSAGATYHHAIANMAVAIGTIRHPRFPWPPSALTAISKGLRDPLQQSTESASPETSP
jgi:V8-like Glu-specific endopeptidase